MLLASAAPIEFRHLRLIDVVSREQNLTRASEFLHLTQSALSHQLRDVEDKLGTRLFRRVGKKMLLTDAGKRMLEASRVVLGELTRAETDIRSMTRGERGRLRVSTECYTCYHWFPSAIRRFRAAYPGVDVSIIAEATHAPIPALLAGALDVGIVSDCVEDKRLRYEPLLRDELVVALSPDHPKAGQPHFAPEDFADEHLFLYVEEKDSTVFREILNPAGVRPHRVSKVELTEAKLGLVQAGLGVCVMARWAIAPYLASGELVGLPLAGGGFFRRWYAAFLNAEELQPFFQVFLDITREELQPLDCSQLACEA